MWARDVKSPGTAWYVVLTEVQVSLIRKQQNPLTHLHIIYCRMSVWWLSVTTNHSLIVMMNEL